MPGYFARRAAALIAAVGLLAPLACGSKDEIHSYQVKKPTETPADEPRNDGSPTAPKVRLLGAIIPVKDGSWFVKFTGPIGAIEPHEKAFDEFVNSIRV